MLDRDRRLDLGGEPEFDLVLDRVRGHVQRSPALVRNVAGTWGEEGRRWLAELPQLLEALCRDWGLRLGEPYDLTFHYVTAVEPAAVLKVGFELADEVAALTAFGGRGAARVLRADVGRGALLLEQVAPGRRLRSLVTGDTGTGTAGGAAPAASAGDAAAVAVLAGLMRELHTAPLADLPPVLSQVGALDRYRGTTVPAGLVTAAAALMRSLCASATRSVVLHGDLHHDNVLSGTREPWLAIDPHGLVGDPAYEVGSVLFNLDPDDRSEALTALVPGRLRQFAELLGEPEERLAAWGFVKAVLSAVWADDAGGPPSRSLDVAVALWSAGVGRAVQPPG